MIKSWTHKTPTEKYSRGLDWSDTIDADIAPGGSFWEVLEGTCTVQTSAGLIDGKNTSVVVLGGTDQEMCILRNRVTTAAGDEYEQLVQLPIRLNG